MLWSHTDGRRRGPPPHVDVTAELVRVDDPVLHEGSAAPTRETSTSSTASAARSESGAPRASASSGDEMAALFGTPPARCPLTPYAGHRKAGAHPNVVAR